MMKNLVCTQPGTFEITDSELPLPVEGSVLLKIKKVGICGTDLHAFKGVQPFFEYPRILGHELACEVVDNTNNPDFAQGELVTVMPYFSCKQCIACMNGKPNCCVNMNVFGVHVDGGMREYINMPIEYVIKGRGLNTDQLAMVEPLAIAAHAIKRAAIVPNEFVLVMGAGPIGVGIIEFAKIAGARVIVIDTNKNRLAFCTTVLGISDTINPINEEVVARLMEITKGQMPTVVIDASGSKQAILNGFQYMAHGARYILVGLQREEINFSHPEFHKREGTLMSSRNATLSDFNYVIDCIKNGLIKPANYITDQLSFSTIMEQFEGLYIPGRNLIKALVSFDS